LVSQLFGKVFELLFVPFSIEIRLFHLHLEGKKIPLSGVIFLWSKTNMPADEASVFSSFPVNGQSIKTVLLLHVRHFHRQHILNTFPIISHQQIESYSTIGVVFI
jgi:hypothetical protein